MERFLEGSPFCVLILGEEENVSILKGPIKTNEKLEHILSSQTDLAQPCADTSLCSLSAIFSQKKDPHRDSNPGPGGTTETQEKNKIEPQHKIYTSINLLPFAQLKENHIQTHNENEQIISLLVQQQFRVTISDWLAHTPSDHPLKNQNNSQTNSQRKDEKNSQKNEKNSQKNEKKSLKNKKNCEKNEINCGKHEKYCEKSFEKYEIDSENETEKNAENNTKNTKENHKFEFNETDEVYKRIVQNIIDNEIKKGEGSSFVIARKATKKFENFNLIQALNIFKRIILHETGCYWKYILFDGDRYFICASPERHLTIDKTCVLLNPISGTFRKNGSSPTTFKNDLLAFLGDEKEIGELFMVTDEELKMMSQIAHTGGQIRGPFLKDMAHVVHTEYVLRAPRVAYPDSGQKNAPNINNDKFAQFLQMFAITMFAPTVTGSPMGNACNRLYEYETCSRRYYSGACLALGIEDEAPFLDSSISIRLAEISAEGRAELGVGATLVKDSQPCSETEETIAKLRGLLGALGDFAAPPKPIMVKDAFQGFEAELETALKIRNGKLSRFWMQSVDRSALKIDELSDKTALLIDNEDGFIHMVSVVMRAIGMTTKVVSFKDYTEAESSNYDLIVVGPGPGDPRETTQNKKIKINAAAICGFLANPRPFLCVCLGHQIFSATQGLEIKKKEMPTQGMQKDIAWIGGGIIAVGFYNSFSIHHDPLLLQSKPREWLYSIDRSTQEILGIRGPHFCTFQFHPESILSPFGYRLIAHEICRLFKIPIATKI